MLDQVGLEAGFGSSRTEHRAMHRSSQACLSVEAKSIYSFHFSPRLLTALGPIAQWLQRSLTEQ